MGGPSPEYPFASSFEPSPPKIERGIGNPGHPVEQIAGEQVRRLTRRDVTDFHIYTLKPDMGLSARRAPGLPAQTGSDRAV